MNRCRTISESQEVNETLPGYVYEVGIRANNVDSDSNTTLSSEWYLFRQTMREPGKLDSVSTKLTLFEREHFLL